MEGEVNALREIRSFYKELYRQDSNVNEELQNHDSFTNDIAIPQLSDEEKQSCDEDITEDEVTTALNCFKMGLRRVGMGFQQKYTNVSGIV